MGQIRILIVDDHAVVRKGLAMVLRLEQDFEVVGEAGNAGQALEFLGRQPVDLLLLDRMMPGMDCLELARRVRGKAPEIKILILTGTQIDQGAIELVAAGVDGYILKDIEPETLKQAIRAVYAGHAYLDPALTRRVIDQMQEKNRIDMHPLTERELEVLGWLQTPFTYREIGGALNVSEETIRSHVKSILGKLDQPNRAQAVLAALRLGILPQK